MPVILPIALEQEWLDPEIGKEHALSRLQPFPAAAMIARRGVTSGELGSERRSEPADPRRAGRVDR
jgi:hypothetical protein